MATPTVVAVQPLTPTQIGMAARLQAQAEAQQAANLVASLPRKVASTPRKVMEFLRLPAIWDKIKGAAGAIGGWLSKAAAPAASFISKVGYLPSAALLATGEKGQALIRWVARSVIGSVSWTVRTAGTFLDGALRMFGRPGNYLADLLLLGATKAMNMLAVPVGIAYAVTAPLVSAKSGHVKLINRMARFLVVHRVVRMFVRNPLIAWPLEFILDVWAIGRMERALKTTVDTAEYAAIRLAEAANEAKAKAAADAYLAGETAANAKIRMTTAAEANKGTTIPQAMGKIGEVIETVSKKTDEVLAAQASPTAAASPGAASNGTAGSDNREGEASTSKVADQPGQPVETAEELAVRLEAEGKIGLVTVPANATREEQIHAAQSAADKLGEDVVAVLSSGQTVVVEPTGTVERVLEAEGPELDEKTPAMSRGTERALQHANAGKRKRK